ncbi:MAG: hypothetical protein KKA36_09010 [Gammaproteobacteria bacterium]|nr:hypothetical protein [Gammaproteobacteria bacterium]MBU2479216.1 hypothetical protein [Gammaproteobacteria bacterium]
MNLIDAIAQPRVLLACLCFGFVNLLLAKGEQHFLIRMAEHSITAWLAEHIYLPLARVFSILLFIGLAYPALFGLREAPGIHSLLSGGDHRVSHLINLGFLLSLFLPLLPIVGRLPSLILPAQGLLAAAMLFSWLAQAQALDVSLWPGWIIAGLVLVWAILGQRLAVWIAQQFGDQWNAQSSSEDRTRVYYETAILFFQIPAILLYTLKLGEQLH